MHLGKLTALAVTTTGLALTAAPATALTIEYASGDPIIGTAKDELVITIGPETLVCANATVSGDINVGTSNPFADITSATWLNCTFGPSTATVTLSPYWHINAVSGMTSGTNDNIAVTITNISNVHVAIDGPLGDCEFEVSGSANGVFDEDNGKGGQSLTITSSNLMASDLDNAFTCLGLVSEGDPATLSGELNFDTFAGEVNIKP